MGFICNACNDALHPAPAPQEILNRVLRHFPGDELALSHIVARYLYCDDPPLSALIHALKYEGCPRIGLDFGAELGMTLATLGFDRYDAVVAVPVHAARRRERGYNQAEEIAAGVRAALNIPVAADLIRRRRYTVSQTTLAAGERTQNLQKAFCAGRNAQAARGATLLLVDDVLTTGSTLNACAATLLELGARRVDAATLAVAE